MKIIFIAGARPNFMKLAPIVRGLESERKKLKR
jgi:UDP-N-acetylglucosamine 2-epimerase